MDDVGQLLQNALQLASDGKWWALGAIGVGALIRFTKPDVRWFPNLAGRWRPIAAAFLGVVLSVLDLVASNNDWKGALRWGMSAAITAMMGHLFGIEVARNGKELPMPGAHSDDGGKGPSGAAPLDSNVPLAPRTPRPPAHLMVEFVLAVTFLACLPGCAGSLEASHRTALSTRAVAQSAGTATDRAACTSLDAAHRTWGALAVASGLLAGTGGVTTLPIPDGDKGARVAVASTALAMGVLAATSVFVQQNLAATWSRECTGNTPVTP